MFGRNFYWGSIRQYVILFGSLLNDIYIQRFDANNNLTQTIKVPVSYGPREKFLTRIQQNPDLQRQIDQILPRMAFEITSMTYDGERKLNTIGRNVNLSADQNKFYSQYNPVPYNLDITLSIMTKNADDGTRIVEQILPFFKPEWTTTVTTIPQLGLTMDIPVILNSVKLEDTYDGSFEKRRAIIWTLGFTLKGQIYGPLNTSGQIKEVFTNLYVPTTNTAAEGVGDTPIAITTEITPGLTANGKPTSNASLSIPFSQISANSDYGFIIDFTENLI